MLHRVALTSLIALPLAAVAGCAAGGADAEDGGLEAGDTEPRLLDTTPSGDDDSAFPHDSELEDGDHEPDSASTPDTSPIFDVEPDACSAICTTCGTTDGCGGTCLVGSCVGDASCVSGVCIAKTKSYLSPIDYPATWSAFAKAIQWTIASEEGSTIHYTTDGSTPTSSSAGGPSPLTLSLPTDGTALKWFSDNGAKEAEQSFTIRIAPTLQTGYGFVVDDLAIDGVSPVVVVAPGTVLNGTAKYQAWVGTGCPMCRQQLVYGIGTTAMGCLYDGSPSTWPGVSGTASTRITAPATAGVYRVRLAWALQLACTDAMTTANPLGIKPTADLATIIVR